MLQLRPTGAAAVAVHGIPAVSSPLVLCDRLISLAQDADRAGHWGTASQLVRLAHSVFDEDPSLRPS